MEDLIRIIVDADNKAKEREKILLEEKEMLSEKIDEEVKQIYDKHMKEAEEYVANKKQSEEKKEKKQIEDIQSKQQSAFIKLQSDYNKNCNKWVDEIVKRTLA